jgi:RNA polymerase sigma factor for flagellar operon FliA
MPDTTGTVTATGTSSSERRLSATELVESTLPLVGHIVRETAARIPSHINRDDLISAGMMALTVSAQSYDPDKGVPFARFAAIRIQGALLDELRGMDWAVRSVRGRAREVEAVRSQLERTLGRSPRSDEVAQKLGLTVRQLDTLQSDVARANVLSLQGFTTEAIEGVLPDPSGGPEALLLRREQLGYLHDAIGALPERLRHVVVSYFFEHRQMSDIAKELGVTESRISQLRSEALRLLKDGMNSQLEPAAVEESGKPSGKQAGNRAAYFAAIAERSTLAGRLARSNVMGEMSSPVTRSA